IIDALTKTIFENAQSKIPFGGFGGAWAPKQHLKPPSKGGGRGGNPRSCRALRFASCLLPLAFYLFFLHPSFCTLIQLSKNPLKKTVGKSPTKSQ
ncbi:MAG: hypothetical protein AAGM27_08070, partial [Cyanobacteria bacterium J06554_3]